MKIFSLPLKTIILSVLALACAPILVACATTDRDEPTAAELAAEKGYALGEEVREIRDYEIHGWQYVSRRALIIPAGPGRHYLITLNRVCSELGTTEVIGFDTSATNTVTRFDFVRVPLRNSNVDDRCGIERIYKITEIDDEE